MTSTWKLRREDILDLDTYEAQRSAFRAAIRDEKAKRRVHLGDYLTFLFENRETVRYQVQEMLRIERRASEADIEHELATYNELLGNPGGLGCTLLIEVEDARERDRKLAAWLALPAHLFVEVEDGGEVRARYDPRQVGRDRLSSVQYLKFDCRGRKPVAIGCDLPGLELRAGLTPEQAEALADDIADTLGGAPG